MVVETSSSIERRFAPHYFNSSVTSSKPREMRKIEVKVRTSGTQNEPAALLKKKLQQKTAASVENLKADRGRNSSKSKEKRAVIAVGKEDEVVDTESSLDRTLHISHQESAQDCRRQKKPPRIKTPIQGKLCKNNPIKCYFKSQSSQKNTTEQDV